MEIYNKVLAEKDDLIKLAKIVHSIINEIRANDASTENNLLNLQLMLEEQFIKGE